MSSANGLVQYTTSCKLCGNAIAKSPSLNLPLIGQPNKRTQDLRTVLLKHLMQKHGEVFAAAVAAFKEFSDFHIFSAFAFEDPSIQPRLELARAAMFILVRKNTVSDASIEEIVATFELGEKAKGVTEAMKALRDACCEFGAHATDFPAAKAGLLPK